jgi:hypothetical protein
MIRLSLSDKRQLFLDLVYSRLRLMINVNSNQSSSKIITYLCAKQTRLKY